MTRPINIEYCKELFELSNNSPSGIFWKERPRKHFKSDFRHDAFNKMSAYKIAGIKNKKSKNRSGAWRVKFSGVIWAVHRIVYSLYYNEDPGEFQIDHKDGNPFNNNPLNLRKATASQNSMNRLGKKGFTSRHKGVCFIKRLNLWRASIQTGYKRKYLGHFETEEEAKTIYELAAKENHGEFAKFELDEHEIQSTVLEEITTTS